MWWYLLGFALHGPARSAREKAINLGKELVDVCHAIELAEAFSTSVEAALDTVFSAGPNFFASSFFMFILLSLPRELVSFAAAAAASEKTLARTAFYH